MADRRSWWVDERAGRTAVIVVLTVGIAVMFLVGLVGAPPATGLLPRQASPSATSSPPVARGGDATVAPADPPATAPQPTGQALPSRAQRLGDSLIAGWILLVLAGGVAVAAVWSRRSIAQR